MHLLEIVAFGAFIIFCHANQDIDWREVEKL